MTPPVLRGLARHLSALETLTSARRLALGVSVAWAVLVTAYAIGFFGIAADTQTRGTLFLDALFFLVALALPILLVWLAAFLADELARQRAALAALVDSAAPLIASLDAVRDTLARHGPASPDDLHKAVRSALVGGGRGPDLAQPIARLIAGQSDLLAGMGALLKTRAAPPPADPAPADPAPAPEIVPAPPPATRPPEPDQPDLPLLPRPDPGAGPDWSDLIRALDFPRDADDRAGFQALRQALRHHSLAQMLQAAEDVLTLLAQEGVFVDDLAVAPVDPADWRRFIAGTRGSAVAGVGGIRDADALETARSLVRADPIFRDTALFLQRRFDVVLSEFARGASDPQIVEIANTRSGRAFMLLARLSGTFD